MSIRVMSVVAVPCVQDCNVRTKKILCALVRLASVFFFASVMSFSASRWASFAFGQVVRMDSCLIKDVTRLRRRALRWAESRLRWRYLTSPPAMMRLAYVEMVV